MTFLIHRFSDTVEIAAEASGLTVRSAADLSRRENWPPDALAATGGWRTALELEQLLELGLAEEANDAIQIPYQNFESIGNEIPVNLISAWSPHSPFLLKIDRKSDLGRSDFEYRYSYLLGGRAVSVERLGPYVKRAGSTEVFLLDPQMYTLVDAMDAFNALPPQAKTHQESWLTFAKVKGCAAEVGAALDSTLRNNDVIVPSMLGLDMREDEDGALTFLPKCAELADRDFHQVFERNPTAEKLYSIDRPGLGRVRIVLSDAQHEVLKRMKRVRRVRGETKERLQRDPIQVFDGVADQVELPYGDRVIGIGDFHFAPAPRSGASASELAQLWQNESLINQAPANATQSPHETGTESPGEGGPEASGSSKPGATDPLDSEPGAISTNQENLTTSSSEKKYLLIQTNENVVQSPYASEAERARLFAGSTTYQRPKAMREDRNLHPHQEDGVRWLQTCSQIEDRTGVLLADDMGVGKTVQILTFLAWCIESGKFPDLSRQEPPFRPVLIVAPLILLDTRTWEREMENFFANQGVIFWPVLALHGEQLAKLRRPDAEGPEVEIGKPVLDLDRIQRHRVVITNYDTLKNYQHSFAYLQNGKPLWSCVVSDEAQEFKIPNTRLSHAMKALESDFHITCTGTPVENRLLDLWNLTDVFQRGLLGPSKDFVERFENADGDGSLTELKKKLLFQQPHSFLLRRTKSDVANLPPKKIVHLSCQMSNQEIALHQQLVNELTLKGGEKRFLTTLHLFSQLYQHPALLGENAEEQSVGELISQSSKLREVLRVLHQIRAQREKAIVFARHRTMQAILAKVFQDQFHLPVRIINGETKMKAGSLRSSGATTRNAILNEFRKAPGFNILILSPFVAGIGLTIVEANHVFHYGRWWNPAVEAQATDRAYRIGQEKSVFVYLPILRDPSGMVPKSFDEGLDLLMQRKQRLAENFLSPLPPEDQIGRELFADLTAAASPGLSGAQAIRN